MNQHEELQKCILNQLREAPGELSQLSLMCRCFGYRHAHKKLLFFSVEERSFKQRRHFEDAMSLLERVIEQADEEYENRKAKIEDARLRGQKRRTKLRSLELVEPPSEEVIGPQRRRLVSGSPNYSPLAGRSIYEVLFESANQELQSLRDDVLKGYGVSGGFAGAIIGEQFLAAIGSPLAPVLQPPQYETIPAELGPSKYALLDKEVSERLEEYPKVVWQKIEIERQLAEDEKLLAKINRNRQAIKRALDALVEEGQVKSHGTRVNALFQLAE